MITLANLKYITKNRLFKEARNRQIRAFFIGIIFLSILISFLGILFDNQLRLAQIITLVLLFVFLNEISKVGAVLRAGARGEQKALRILKGLPKSYIILNQIGIPLYNDSNRSQEIDYIILGPGCIFVIEVKYKSGIISGSKDDQNWQADKGRTKSEFKNPIKQLTRQIKFLERFLASYEYYPEIQGALLFTHPKSIFKLSKEIRKIVYLDKEILFLIKKYNRNKILENSEMILKLLCFEKERKMA